MRASGVNLGWILLFLFRHAHSCLLTVGWGGRWFLNSPICARSFRLFLWKHVGSMKTL